MNKIKVIRLEIKGLINSFRVPDFQTYHKTLLYPPKTTICGMIGSALGYSPQEVSDKLLTSIRVAVVIKILGGKANDLWKIKKITKFSKGDEKMNDCVVIANHSYYGSVIMRELLYQAEYLVYITSEDPQLLSFIIEKINNPEWALTLGREDELVKVKLLDSAPIELLEEDGLYFTDTVLPFDVAGKYELDITSIKALGNVKRIVPPIVNKLPISFEFKGEERTANLYQSFTALIGIKIRLKEKSCGYKDSNYCFQFF